MYGFGWHPHVTGARSKLADRFTVNLAVVDYLLVEGELALALLSEIACPAMFLPHYRAPEHVSCQRIAPGVAA